MSTTDFSPTAEQKIHDTRYWLRTAECELREGKLESAAVSVDMGLRTLTEATTIVADTINLPRLKARKKLKGGL